MIMGKFKCNHCIGLSSVLVRVDGRPTRANYTIVEEENGGVYSVVEGHTISKYIYIK